MLEGGRKKEAKFEIENRTKYFSFFANFVDLKRFSFPLGHFWVDFRAILQLKLTTWTSTYDRCKKGVA